MAFKRQILFTTATLLSNNFRHFGESDISTPQPTRRRRRRRSKEDQSTATTTTTTTTTTREEGRRSDLETS